MQGTLAVALLSSCTVSPVRLPRLILLNRKAQHRQRLNENPCPSTKATVSARQGPVVVR